MSIHSFPKTFTILLFLFASFLFAEVQMPAIFSDHMVLQHNREVTFWGTAAPGEQITVELKKGKKILQQRKTAADVSGKWRITLKPVKAGGPYAISVRAANEINFNDVLFGEVWLCSGQSNMEWLLEKSSNAALEISNANYPKIRAITVAKVSAETPQSDIKGTWTICAPSNVGKYSAVGYFFGRDIHLSRKIPVGLIFSSWGGSRAEAWTTAETLRGDAELTNVFVSWNDAVKKNEVLQRDFIEYRQQLEREGKRHPDRHVDLTNEGFAKGWHKGSFAEKDWTLCTLPSVIENIPAIGVRDGAYWFRKTVEIPAAWQGKSVQIELGTIDDYDVTYFNGTEVGKTVSNSAASPHLVYRRYIIAPELVKAGKAVIAVRIFDVYAGGGFTGQAAHMNLSLVDSLKETANTVSATNIENVISLAGEWKMGIEKKLFPSGNIANFPGPGHRDAPAGLYNAMIHPLVPYALAGTIWYQGESNAGKAKEYKNLLSKMITDWRKAWNYDFAFGIVQLANFKKRSEQPEDTAWARLREAQEQTATTVPGCGMSVTIEIGEEADIHPRNKQDVGKRLALWARATVYKEKVVYRGPVFEKMEVSEEKIVLTFSSTAKGLATKGSGALKGFAIADDSKKFVWADAVIVGNTVEVSAKGMTTPVAVRYGWGDNPEVNLWNGVLPAAPFRTDDW